MKYQSGQLIKIKDFGEYVITDNLEEENNEYYFIYNYQELENNVAHEQIEKLVLVYDKIKDEERLESNVEKITEILLKFTEENKD